MALALRVGEKKTCTAMHINQLCDDDHGDDYGDDDYGDDDVCNKNQLCHLFLVISLRCYSFVIAFLSIEVGKVL